MGDVQGDVQFNPVSLSAESGLLGTRGVEWSESEGGSCVLLYLGAAGRSESHQLIVVGNEEGLSLVTTPMVLQEYANHDGVLFKVREEP